MDEKHQGPRAPRVEPGGSTPEHVTKRLDELGVEQVKLMHERDLLPQGWGPHILAWLTEREKAPERPDWPPRASAVGLPDGEQRHGSTGQLFEVKDGRWVRVNGDDQRG